VSRPAVPRAIAATGGAPKLTERVTVQSGVLAEWPLRRLVTALAALDVGSVELVPGHLGIDPRGRWGPQADAVRAELERSGVRARGVAAPSGAAVGSAELTAVIEIAAVLDAGFVRAFAPAYDRSRSARDQIDDAAAALDSARAAASPLGVDVLLETAQGTLAPSPELAWRLIERAGPQGLGVVYDPANMIVEGDLDPHYAVSYLGAALKHVHVKNQVLVRRTDRWTPERTPLDCGCVSWVKVADALATAGYTGWLSIDHLSGPPSAARLRDDVDGLRRLVAAGVARSLLGTAPSS
jgi:sugar phosphate isomerase/epimerase